MILVSDTEALSPYEDKLLRPMSHRRFYRATLSRDKIASVKWRVAQCNFAA